MVVVEVAPTGNMAKRDKRKLKMAAIKFFCWDY